MFTKLRTLFRKLKFAKPCPVKNYRKEDLDFIFSLYNTENFTEPFHIGDDLKSFQNKISELHKALQIHRHPDDKENSVQANLVFRNLGAIVNMNQLGIYNNEDWRYILVDALRFNCAEVINNLLDEYEYDDNIINHRIYLEAPLVQYLDNPEGTSTKTLPMDINEAKKFLTEQKLNTSLLDEYLQMLNYSMKFR